MPTRSPLPYPPRHLVIDQKDTVASRRVESICLECSLLTRPSMQLNETVLWRGRKFYTTRRATMSSPSRHPILVVDDEPSIRDSLALLLDSAGYDVSTARDGFAALTHLKRTLPDLVLSDLSMPQMSGYELLSVVRRRFPQIVTVAMSGDYSGDVVPAGVIADAFFGKGQSLRNLLATIAALIRASDTWACTHKVDAPAWIPRNGNDANGLPYVLVTCIECLRSFQLPVIEETTGKVQEAACRFCPAKNRYIIEPATARMREVYA